MKYIGQLYSQYVNKTYKRTGGIWDGRFKSCLVLSAPYLLTCYRYVELNPVRGGLVSKPQDYRWSSYRANAGVAPCEMLTPHEEYLRLGRDDEDRKRAYAELVAGGIDETQLSEIRLSTNGGHSLGGLSRVRPGSVPDRV